MLAAVFACISCVFDSFVQKVDGFLRERKEFLAMIEITLNFKDIMVGKKSRRGIEQSQILGRHSLAHAATHIIWAI